MISKKDNLSLTSKKEIRNFIKWEIKTKEKNKEREGIVLTLKIKKKINIKDNHQEIKEQVCNKN